MKLKDKNENLFLAVEQGAGKYDKSVTVVINQRTINKSKQWLAIKYPKLVFKNNKSRKTSVDAEKCKVDTTYNE